MKKHSWLGHPLVVLVVSAILLIAIEILAIVTDGERLGTEFIVVCSIVAAVIAAMVRSEEKEEEKTKKQNE